MCLHVERNSMIQETHIEEDLARWNLNSPHLQRTAPQSPGVMWRMWGKLEIKNQGMENHGIYPDESNGNTFISIHTVDHEII